LTTSNHATVLDCFLLHEAEQRDKPYLIQPLPDGTVVEYTWGEVGEQARRMAAYFLSLGLPKGSRIAILGKNSAHWIIADLATIMAGMVSVPLFPMYSGASVRYTLEHSEARLLVLGKLDGHNDNWPTIRDHLPAGLPMLGLPLSPPLDIAQWQQAQSQHAPLQALHQPQDNELATILYTSGSTGEPKGVMHSHGTLAATIDSAQRGGWWGATPRDRGFSYLPLAHAAERIAVEMSSMAFGYPVYFSSSQETFLQDIKRARPTIFFSVPRLWTQFYLGVNEQLPPSKQKLLFTLPVVSGLVKKKILRQLGLDQVRIAVTAAAPMPVSLMNWYRALGLELLETYGMSETAAISHSTRPGYPRSGTVGQPNPGVEARIAANGELELRSPTLMLGYYRQPALTADCTTPDGFLRTGDCGEIDPDGYLRITGRIKDIFKTSGGKYIAPAPIEARLFRHPRFEAVCVIGMEQPMPFAVLLLSEDAREALGNGALVRDALTAELEGLRRHVNSASEHHEQLQYLVVVKDGWSVENAMLTPTLKIRRQAIEQRYLPLAPAWAATGHTVIWEA